MFGAMHLRKRRLNHRQDDRLRHDTAVALVVMAVLTVIALLMIWAATIGGGPVPNLEYWPVVP